MTIETMAFPTHDANPGTDPRSQILTGGMTLLDYFAAQAVNGMLASESGGNDGAGFYSPEHAAERAYQFAHAMVTARKGPDHGRG